DVCGSRAGPGASRVAGVMATSPGRTCGSPGCPRPPVDQDAHCEVHGLAARRDPAVEGWYDACWEEIRRGVLREEPFCRLCSPAGRRSASEHVDHIKPPDTSDPPDTYAREHLRALCARCYTQRPAADPSPPEGPR